MENKPFVDRELLIPILLGGFSIVGIAVVLLIGRALNAPAEVAATPSATPFQYLYLGTEPAISTAFFEGSDIAPPLDETSADVPFINATPMLVSPTGSSSLSTPTRSSSVATPLILPTTNATSTSGVIVLRTNTPSGLSTPTSTSTASAANTYDDTDSRLEYSSGWLSQTGVTGAYQSTLHVSDVADDKSVQFTFTGREIHFFYQSSPSFGTVTIYLDNDPLGITLSQSQGGGEWVHILDEATSHQIEIAHTDGGSVNIDRFVIPAPTPTPTRTPTPTP